MATGAYILLASVIIGIIVGVMMAPGPPDNNMEPNSLDSFQVTQSSEGSVVPIIFGTRRIAGNLLWYGNLETIELTESVGKGGSEDMTTGYRYYMDLWQAICLGPDVEILSGYSQDKPIALSDFGTYTLNPGDTDYFPTEAGEFSAPLHGVSHIFLDRFLLGENVSMVPTLHFVVKKESSAPITHANMSNGVNPSAIIYDLFIMAGADPSDFDLPSFQSAADYWYGLGYGLNISFNKQQEVRTFVRQVLVYVDGAIRIDENDKIVLKAFKSTDTKADEMVTIDFKEFQFIRRTWDDVYTDFRANYIDEDQDYTKRTIRVRNAAVHKLIGYDRQKTIDLSAFRDVDTASARLWEMMKRMSYPEAQIECTVGIKFAGVNIGDIIEVTNDDYGMAGADFRVMRKDEGDLESNDIKFSMTQMLDNLFDNNYLPSGGPIWSTPSYNPVALVNQKIFELPYNNETGVSPSYLLLAAREGVETKFTSLISIDGVDYLSHDSHFTFSQKGTIVETYNEADTYWLDDVKGILFTPYRDDPEFTSVSRQELFGGMRVAIIGNEMIGFQTVMLEGASNVRLTGCVRGILNTPIEDHAISDTIWLTNVGSSILRGLVVTDFYVKLIPYFGQISVDPASVTPMHVVSTNKAATPNPIGRIEAVRSGSNVSIKLQPVTRVYPGVGVMDMRYHTDLWPPSFDGVFEYYNSIIATVMTETDAFFNYTQASAHTFYARHTISGFSSSYKSVSVGSADGTYIGPIL